MNRVIDGSTAQELGRKLISLRLVTDAQLQDALMELRAPGPDELLNYFERQSLLTAFQLSKLQSGDTSGFILGRFKLLYKISAGTFARVFRGADIQSGESVAIKILRSRHSSDKATVELFRREAELTRGLEHPNITRTLEVGYDSLSNQHFIAMEFVEGGNLREFLKIRKKIEPAEMIRYACEMTEGLAYALSRGVTHRDLKPTNLLISAEGRIKLVDFGLAGVDDGQGPKEQRTVDYAGLEKATDAPRGDPRSDIFFLGTVFYQMLTGRPAMPETRDKHARMLRDRFREIEPLADSSIPAPLAAVVDRMLAFRPEARYQTYDELHADLLAVRLDGAADNVEAGRRDASRRVILVHRSEKVQQTIRDALAGKGYQVVLTGDIGRALTLHKLKPTDCFIIDLKTTGQGGVVQYRRLGAESSAGPRRPVIFLATDTEAVWTSGLDAEQCVTLRKPLTLGPVYRALKQFVQ